MSGQSCQQALDGVGVGIANSLRAVDCVANEMSGQAFGRIFAPGGAMVPVLVTLLTLFVAGYAVLLLMGRTNLGIRALMPRMFTLGLVLTFATSWAAYQGVVWNLAIGAPDWLASLLTGTQGSATITFADKLDVVFMAIQQASEAQQAGNAGGPEISAFSPPGLMWLGTMLLLLGTVGVLVTARIALAVLVGLGPIFVVMALFNGTRGLFTGWVKGVTMMALTPLFAVLGGGLMLELTVPVLSALVATPGQINPQAAVAFFLIGAVHVALMIMVLKVAGTMVSGWTVFGMVPDRSEASSGGSFGSGAAGTGVPMMVQPAATEPQAPAPTRRIPVAAIPAISAANDTGGAGGGGVRRETRIVQGASSPGQTGSLSQSTSRARGIGSRFRSASSSRLLEKK
ncbi:MAG: type IV secretion system protein [Sphingomonadales bacterium]|nr:type IV secretion system protein [Sphingomonadales bacterium]MBD3772975.1 type IV secretion system protein [Paracoccaceae bacterium]